jgi:hypothetical protein
VAVAVFEHVFTSVYAYVICCVPELGSKVDPETPVPENVPPAGEPTKAKSAASIQTAVYTQALTVGSGFTVTVT